MNVFTAGSGRHDTACIEKSTLITSTGTLSATFLFAGGVTSAPILTRFLSFPRCCVRKAKVKILMAHFGVTVRFTHVSLPVFETFK